jgi:peptidyl-prolyl cis-trans isomerase SurA
MAEARKRHITVSPVEVDKRLEEWAARQNTNVKDLSEALAKAGSSIEVVREQQIASIAWGKTVYSEFGDNVVVTPAMVDDTMRRDIEGANKTHYRVMEIFLPVDNSGDAAKDAEVKKQIEDINAKIRSGTVLFRNLAQQYSRDPSAAAGGDIGWVYDGQLDPDLNAALAKMRNGELSQPVRAKGGWYLLGLQERQEPMGTNVSIPETVAPASPPGTLPLARLLLPVPRTVPAEQIQNLLANAERIREATASCDMLEKISQDKQLDGSVFMNPLKFAKLVNPSTTVGFIKLSDLSEQIQKALQGTKPGDVAAPFQSDAGIEIIARCDPRPPPPRTVFTPRKRDDIEADLFQEQIAAMARRFMRDLKRDANIQERNDNAVMDAALIQ